MSLPVAASESSQPTIGLIEFRVPISQIQMNSVCWVPLQTLRVQNTSEASPYILKGLLLPVVLGLSTGKR